VTGTPTSAPLAARTERQTRLPLALPLHPVGPSTRTPERRAFCTCTLGELQRTMTWEQFRTVGQAATAGDPAARQRYAAAVVACADQVPR